ncbi:Uncharacterised protein [Mycobacteroides abscessus subsp. abscessus]|nr:Uncharacterised protein [Mycobacteroides abscessus subsp. abscessus]
MSAHVRDLGLAAGRGQTDVMQVTVDVEVVVVDPHRVIQIQPAIGEFLPEGRDALDAFGQLGPQFLERVATRNGCGV